MTGALISGSDRFVQLLEGDRAGLERCFSRIRRDRCHRDIAILVCEEARELLFPDAAMRGVKAGGGDIPVGEALSPKALPTLVMEAFEKLARRSGPSPTMEPDAADPQIVLQRIHWAARHILDDHLTRRPLPPETLRRLGDSLARQAAQARTLRQRLDVACSTDPEHGLEALRLCELLEGSEREVARRLGGQG